VVAVPPYSVHRDASLYPEPEKFNPCRWLDKDNAIQLNALKNYNIPFSTGPRACLGRHIAIVELQILIASLVQRFDMEFERLDQELSTFERFQSNPGPLPVRLRRRQISAAA
jgi:benzoate 4-monooxygenase